MTRRHFSIVLGNDIILKESIRFRADNKKSSLDVDYNKVSAYGHFGKAGIPWEE